MTSKLGRQPIFTSFRHFFSSRCVVDFFFFSLPLCPLFSPLPSLTRYKRSKSSASNSIRQIDRATLEHKPSNRTSIVVRISIGSVFGGRTLIKVAIPGARRRFATTRYQVYRLYLHSSVVLVYRTRAPLQLSMDGSFS